MPKKTVGGKKCCFVCWRRKKKEPTVVLSSEVSASSFFIHHTNNHPGHFFGSFFQDTFVGSFFQLNTDVVRQYLPRTQFLTFTTRIIVRPSFSIYNPLTHIYKCYEVQLYVSCVIETVVFISLQCSKFNFLVCSVSIPTTQIETQPEIEPKIAN